MSKNKRLKIVVSIICISFIQGLQFSLIPVLGPIGKHFSNVSVSMIQMLITAPTLLAMIIALISGGLVVKISKKKLLIIAGFVAGITGFLPLFADSFMLLFVSRILYGLALGLAMTLNTAVVAEFFEGEERTQVMGIQAASVGMGMVIITMAVGRLGAVNFENSYYINVIGIVAMIIIAICLPETGTVKVSSNEKIQINKKVWMVTIIGLLEMMFLITFSTNIAMHISGTLSGSTTVSGNLTGIYSAAQIVIGLVLGIISKITKNYTLPVAMLSFCIGGILLILFPANLIALMVGAMFCGFSQGIFIPTAMVEVSNAVSGASTAMASACLTCGISVGQLISPMILNSTAQCVFGSTTTTNVYLIAVIGMFISIVIVIGTKRCQER